MKKTIKIFFILLCLIFILCFLNLKVYGANFNPDDYEPDSTTYSDDVGELKTVGNTIIGLIRTIGSIASVGVLIVLGIKYMAGSLEEKAKYKETMIPYIIGAALVFGITNILAVIINIAGLF